MAGCRCQFGQAGQESARPFAALPNCKEKRGGEWGEPAGNQEGGRQA